MADADTLQKVLITGGTGLIGTPLCSLLLEGGLGVHVLSRGTGSHPVEGVKTFQWAPERGELDDRALEGVSTIVHLAGAGIADGRWTRSRRQEIIDSRVKTADVLKKALDRTGAPVNRIVSASAIGYYGYPKKPVDERGSAGETFPAQVCEVWEQAARDLAGDARSLIIVRVGIVLAREGGALPRLMTPVSLGAGLHLGSGDQIMSWVHLRDIVGIFAAAVADPSYEGVYNGVAPEPVSQKFLVKQLARHLHRPYWGFGVPSLALWLALGAQAELVLRGASVTSSRLAEVGFSFRYPGLYEALHELLKKGKK